MNTAPEAEEKSAGQSGPPPLTRLKAAEEEEQDIHIPPNPLPHITDWLFEIGPSSANGMGESPIDWPSIAAWSDQVGIELNAWEARTIRGLSQDFINMRFEARKASCPAPFDPDAEDEAKIDDRVAAQFKAMMAAFATPSMTQSVIQRPKP